MKKFNLNKIVIIALLIIVASFSAITITAKDYQRGATPNAVTKVINDTTGGVDQLFTRPGRFIEAHVNAFQNVLNASKQNEALKARLSSLSDDKAQLSSLKDENQQLKAALKLKDTLSSYTTTAANVITRNPSSWDDLLIIDKGARDGLKPNMIVMAGGGIIGRVSQVNRATSKITLLTSSKNLVNKVPVQIDNSYGLLSDYDSKTGDYIVTNLTTSDSFDKGAHIVTSGLGGDSPSQLLLGSYAGQSGRSTDSNRKLYVKPASNFYKVQIVTIVERQVEGN